MRKKIFFFCWILGFPTLSSAQESDLPLKIVPLSEEEMKQYPIYPVETEKETKPPPVRSPQAEEETKPPPIAFPETPKETARVPIYFPKAEKGEGLLQLEFGWLTLGAEFEGEFAAIQGDEFFPFANDRQGISHNDRQEDRFSINKLTLISQFDFKDKIQFYSEFEALVNRTETESAFFREAHVTFFPTSKFFIKAGLDDRFISPEFTAENDATGDDKRLTEIFPINGTAFWKDEDVGLIVGGNHPFREKTTVYWRGSLTNGLNLRFDEITRNQIYPILHDDRDISTINIDFNHDKEYGAGIGIRHLLRDDLRFNLFGFHYGGHLRESDRAFLRDVVPNYASTNKTHTITGFNFSFHFSSFDFFSQYIRARNSSISRDGFYVEPSFYLTTGREELFKGVRFLYRWNTLDVEEKGFQPNPSLSPFLWDRVTHSFGLNIQIHPYVLFRNEYHWNREDTGDDPEEVYNNEFLSQLEVKF